MTVLFLPPTVFALYIKPEWGVYILYALGVGFVLEWIYMCTRSPFSLLQKRLWFVCGTLYLLIAVYGLLLSVKSLLAIFAVIWATDIGAYIAGRSIGGPKLCPKISPNKTWSGAIGGTICGILFGLVASTILHQELRQYSTFFIICASTSISIVGQVGDLIESWAKRRMQIKDSSQIIPGHGGILDRFDSLIFVGFVLALLSIFQ